jgi:tRNA uridine 5-carbamoylmethylation protein Kti12
MSDDFEEGASIPAELLPLLIAAQEEPEAETLRWTPTTFFIDLLNAVALVLEGVASFFTQQSRSLAARASLKEELKDHALRQQLKAEERRRMQLQTLEDIAILPESQG